MWPFGKRRSLIESGILDGFTDWHSHILPGVDDGVQTVDEALEILRLYENAGVRSVWLTPHVMEDIPNTTGHLAECFRELKSAYRGKVGLHLASENMLDILFEERLSSGDFLPIGSAGRHLLVETSYFNPPMDLYGMLDRIKAKGYHPVLAHPERYTYMGDGDYYKLHNMGVKFQLNLFSLSGMYGTDARKKAMKLMKNGFYRLSGTDLHSIRQLCSAEDFKSAAKFGKDNSMCDL